MEILDLRILAFDVPGPAVSAAVMADQEMLRGQRAPLFFPGFAVEQPVVEQDHGRSFAANLVVDLGPADAEAALGFDRTGEGASGHERRAECNNRYETSFTYQCLMHHIH
jgi:hypothetical protein